MCDTGSFQTRLEFIAWAWLVSGAHNSSLQLPARRFWPVWDIFGRFPEEAVLTRGKPFDAEGPKHSSGAHRAGLGVCVQESSRDKEGAASWAATQSKSPGNLQSKAQNCLEVQAWSTEGSWGFL